VELTINGGTVEFELEREKNLGEVLYSLDTWLDGHGLIISGVDVDGASVGGDILSVKDRGLDSIDRLDIRTERVSVFRGKALSSACAWLDGILGRSSGSVEAGEALLSSASGFLNPEEISYLELAQADLTATGGASADIPRIAAIFKDRLAECEDPPESLRKAAAAFRSDRESILNIPVWLQTGRDREAMDAISRFTEAFSTILRLMPALIESGIDASSLMVDGKPYADFFSDLNGVLNELMEAFGSRDTVLIGDLAEYEVLPRLDSIFAALEKATT
jgi:hypothetical protein